MSDAPVEHLSSEAVTERRRLIDLVAGLAPEQWASPSLCRGWRVREVVAHLTMPFRMTLPAYAWGMLRSGFRFDRFSEREAGALTERLADADLLALWRRHADDRWQPPGGGPAGALSHELIHGLDITDPLGLPSAPPERYALMVRHLEARNLAHFGVSLDGVRLEADDVDAAVGEGRALRLPVRELVLVITGRRSLEDARG